MQEAVLDPSALAASYRRPDAFGRPELSDGPSSLRLVAAIPRALPPPLGEGAASAFYDTPARCPPLDCPVSARELLPLREHVSASGFASEPFVSL